MLIFFVKNHGNKFRLKIIQLSKFIFLFNGTLNKHLIEKKITSKSPSTDSIRHSLEEYEVILCLEVIDLISK